MFKQIEAKVVAAIAGGGVGGGILAKFALWILGVAFFHASTAAAAADKAVASVPGPVATFVVASAAAIGAGIAGYAAPHSDPSGTETTASDQPDTLAEASAIFPN